MNNKSNYANSEDEDDLEALRLEALKTLKKSQLQDNSSHSSFTNQEQGNNNQSWSPKGYRNKRGKFFGTIHQRGGKNGHFGRERSTTLIPIKTVDDKPITEEDKSSDEKDNTGSTSKFARYDKSDTSESESEEEVENSDDIDNKNLKRSDSLEALMQELDDEIQGKNRSKDGNKVYRVKAKKIKKKKSVSECENKSPNVKEHVEIDDNKQTVEKFDNNEENANKEPTKVENIPEQVTANKNFNNNKRFRSRSPNHRRGFYNRRKPPNFQISQNIPLPSPLIPFPPAQFQQTPPFEPHFPPMYPQPMNMPPQVPFYDRPISPLSINTAAITTCTMAPLSPRSAAFVLENKAIIERRKRSPRRSYSRSFTPSPRRSFSPRKRSLSPRRSRSPRRLPPRKRSLSPRRKSLSPYRRSLSPKKPKLAESKAPVRDRLGLKSKLEENKAKDEDECSKKDEKPLDPILEARKKKFETNEIKIKEGIIRLKPKETKPKEDDVKQEKIEEKAPVRIEKPKVEVAPATTTVEEKPIRTEKDVVPDEFKELELLLNVEPSHENDELETSKVDDIFSDEDSESDNEGRFKIKEQKNAKPPILSYSKLVNGETTTIKKEPLLSNKRNRQEKIVNNRNASKIKIRSTTPPLKKPVKDEQKKADSTDKVVTKRLTKSERQPPSMDKKFERKIEIKIKNPSKYERATKIKAAKVNEKNPRKINVEKEESDEEEMYEHEIEMAESNSDDEDVNINEGDLRAQLSKKRAKKLHKLPVEGVPSRLLQFALQETILKKKSKKKSKDKNISASDGKLPIHLRLGLANNGAEAFPEGRLKRKSRKRKNRELLEQV